MLTIGKAYFSIAFTMVLHRRQHGGLCVIARLCVIVGTMRHCEERSNLPASPKIASSYLLAMTVKLLAMTGLYLLLKNPILLKGKVKTQRNHYFNNQFGKQKMPMPDIHKKMNTQGFNGYTPDYHHNKFP